MLKSANSKIWNKIALAGGALLVFGFGCFSLNAIDSEFPDNFTLFFSVIAAGVVCLFAGAIGRALSLDSRKLKRMSLLLLLGPITVCVLAGMIDPNVHGIFPIFFLASVPLCILGIILIAVSMRSQPNAKQGSN